MIFRIEPTQHPLSSDGQLCAAIIVEEVYKDRIKSSPVAFGWGQSWESAVSDCLNRYRQIRNSSRIAKKKELMDTQKIPAFANQPTTPLDPAIKAQLDAEMQKVREMIHSSDRVLLAAQSLELDKEAILKLEESRRNARISLIKLSPKEE